MIELLLAALLVAIGLVWVVVRVWCVLDRDGENESRDEKAEAIRRIHDHTSRQIEETTDYYVSLFRYIAERVDDETRRRQSSQPSTRLGNSASEPVVASGPKEPQYAGVSVEEEQHNGIPTSHLGRTWWLLNAR